MDYKVSAIVMLCQLKENGKVISQLNKVYVIIYNIGIMLSILDTQC